VKRTGEIAIIDNPPQELQDKPGYFLFREFGDTETVPMTTLHSIVGMTAVHASMQDGEVQLFSEVIPSAALPELQSHFEQQTREQPLTEHLDWFKENALSRGGQYLNNQNRSLIGGIAIAETDGGIKMGTFYSRTMHQETRSFAQSVSAHISHNIYRSTEDERRLRDQLPIHSKSGLDSIVRRVLDSIIVDGLAHSHPTGIPATEMLEQEAELGLRLVA
jgi:hypothetical protein